MSECTSSILRILFGTLAIAGYLGFVCWGGGDQLDTIDLGDMLTAQTSDSFLVWGPVQHPDR